MKGIGGGISLFIASVGFIAIITIVAASFLGFFSFETFVDTCRKDTIGQVNSWIEKMALPGAGNFNDEMRLSECVEYVNDRGVKFKGEDLIVFKTTTGDDLQFDLSDISEARIDPEGSPYSVTVISSAKKVRINPE